MSKSAVETLLESLSVESIDKLINECPDEFFELLRHYSPFFTYTREEGGPETTIVTRAKDVREVLNQHFNFKVPYAPAMDPATGPFMLGRDTEPLHDHEKGIMMSILKREDAPRIRAMTSEFMKKNIREAVDAEGKLDIAEIGRKIVVQILESYFGLEGPDYDTVVKWCQDPQRSFFINPRDPEVVAAGTAAGVEMRKHIREVLIPKRMKELETNPDKEDALSRMLRTKFVPEANFDMERIVSNTMGFAVGSGRTVNNLICKLFNQLLEMPDAFKMALEAAHAGDDDRLADICLEAARFDIASYLPRFVPKETYLDGHTFKAGTTVFVCRRSAFFDENWVKNPKDFNPDRPGHIKSFVFSSGIHRCLGEHVARNMIPIVVKEILTYKPNLGRAEGSEYVSEGGFSKSLMVQYKKDDSWLTSKVGKKIHAAKMFALSELIDLCIKKCGDCEEPKVLEALKKAKKILEG